MKLFNIINAYEDLTGKMWELLPPNKRVEFALQLIESETKQALKDIEVAVYTPELSSISVEHACNHLRQCLSIGKNKD